MQTQLWEGGLTLGALTQPKWSNPGPLTRSCAGSDPGVLTPPCGSKPVPLTQP